MNKQKNNREQKCIFVSEATHKKLYAAKGQMGFPTLSRTIDRLFERHEELLEREDDFKDQTKNMVEMRKRLEILEETKNNKPSPLPLGQQFPIDEMTTKVPDIVNENVE